MPSLLWIFFEIILKTIMNAEKVDSSFSASLWGRSLMERHHGEAHVTHSMMSPKCNRVLVSLGCSIHLR
jgi:hypothetical protein